MTLEEKIADLRTASMGQARAEGNAIIDSHREALEKVSGVESVDVSLEGKMAEVTCTEQASRDEMRKAITEAGYEVTGIEG